MEVVFRKERKCRLLEGNMNKLILEGKEYTLSDELIEKIKAEVTAQEKAKNPFERKTDDKGYFYVNERGEVKPAIDRYFSMDSGCFKVANYCRDKKLMEQRALYETLNRLLWRYSIEHDGEIICYGLDCLYEISYNIRKHGFEIMWTNTRIDEGAILFKKEETARNAIEEVIKPFLEEHPEFHYFRW